MKTIRFFLAAFGAALAVFAVVAACGGQLVVGYDDAGNYHTADGAIFQYGGGCVGFDASPYLIDGGPPCDASGPDPYCTSLLVPATLSQYYLSWCANGVCAGPQWSIDAGSAAPFESPPCNLGPAGDDFCVAFFDRFITHGHVIAHCAGSASVAGCSAIIGDTCNGEAASVPFHVRESDGAVDCVNPCEP